MRPYLTIAPARLAPVVLTCEHACNRLPTGLRSGRAERRVLESHWGWDIGGWPLTRELAGRLATSAIGGRWSRLFIDLNRRIDDPTLIRRRVGKLELSWNAAVDAAEIERRVETIHAPYHLEVDRLIARRVVRGIRPLLLAIHTFTPIYDGRARRFQVGILYERHRGLAQRLGRRLRDDGLDVRYNRPYSGMAGMMYSVDRHGKHHGLPCLEIEVNHEMFADARTVSRLGRAIAGAVRDLPGPPRG